MKLTNTSGAALHVPSLGRVVGAGETVDAAHPIPGFDPAPTASASTTTAKAAAKATAPTTPAATAAATPKE